MPFDALTLLLNSTLGVGVPTAPPLLPTWSELNTQLTNDPVHWRAMIVSYITDHVGPRLAALPTTAVRGAPASAAQRWDTMPRLRQVMSKPSAVTGWAKPVTNQLPNATVSSFDYKLRGFQGHDDISAGLDLLEAYLPKSTLPPGASANKQVARQSVLNLGALDAFLVRHGAAIKAAAVTQMSLAEVLAVSRTEGDLISPLSLLRFDERWPYYEFLTDISLGPVHTPIVLETMRRGLWSFPFNQMFAAGATLPADAAAKAAFEAAIKSFALGHWLLVIGGLDFLAQRIPHVMDAADMRTVVTNFMDENRVWHGAPSNLVARQNEFDTLFASLGVRWPTSTTGRVAVAPQKPELLVSFVLTEALFFFTLDKDQGQGPFVEPPPSLKYLAYNLQHARSNALSEDDRFIHCLSSAAVAANRDVRPEFAPLKGLLALLGLRSALLLDPKVDSSEHVEEFNKLTGPPAHFLATSANFDLLADYVLRAPDGPWHAFAANRANLARYRQLLAYYSALLA